MTNTSVVEVSPAVGSGSPRVLSVADVLAHWQGHRCLTRRVIEAFPEDRLFSFTAAPPMRTFGELTLELWGLTGYHLRGLTTDDWSWQPPESSDLNTRAAVLDAWDAQTPQLESAFAGVEPGWFTTAQDMAWGRFSPQQSVAFAVDNEIHHRGQGYVYLRALGIEPPAFYDYMGP
ncbi:DinB family protein [Deinococcus aerophilus]|uniref:DNA damage-inducible protein DinB n=1 Tax=Deinococcus aerophilus TaxID=522488 RepID=A0ABQ2GIJ8_9DEIO|nr:DinB family protein [Deinococcus aerophilus]GGL97047.1 DNA damage-inducible protein DinB [Deinococcus aerophilus]